MYKRLIKTGALAAIVAAALPGQGFSQVYPTASGKIPMTDVFMPFNPSPPPSGVTTWTGVIDGYRVIGEQDGIPQRTQIRFRPVSSSAEKTVYVSLPLYVDGSSWQCTVPPSVSVYRHAYNVCDRLPKAIHLGKTTVQIRVWDTRSMVDATQVVPITNSITIVGKRCPVKTPKIEGAISASTYIFTRRYFANGPEAIVRVATASPVTLKTQHIVVYGSPCLGKQYSRPYHFTVVTPKGSEIRSGDVLIYGAFIGDNRWYIRRLSSAEMRKYDSCTWKKHG